MHRVVHCHGQLSDSFHVRRRRWGRTRESQGGGSDVYSHDSRVLHSELQPHHPVLYTLITLVFHFMCADDGGGAPASPKAAAPAKGDLLSQIQAGARLKKVMLSMEHQVIWYRFDMDGTKFFGIYM
jgi:hypothetical protein